MEACVTVVVRLAVEIQQLIQQNEALANQTNSLLIFIGTLQTALSPLVAFESLPHQAQANIQGNVSILTSTMESLKRELKEIVKNGFTVTAGKTLILIQKREIDLRNILKALQVNWELVNTINQEAKFNAMRLITHTTAKRFWATHFGAEIKYAEWNDFKHTMHGVYCVQDKNELAILEKALSQDNKVSVYSFDSLTRAKGVPASFWHCIYSENKERAKVALEEERHVVKQLYEKLISTINGVAIRIGTNSGLFIEGIPTQVADGFLKKWPDFGILRVVKLGSLSAKELQDKASSVVLLETTNWREAVDSELKLCVSQLTFTLNAALSDGLGQRLLAPEVMEARINKITTHLSQKGFVEQITDNIVLQASKIINEKISTISGLSLSDSAGSAAGPLFSLTKQKEAFGSQIQEIVDRAFSEILTLMFLQPITRMLENNPISNANDADK